MGDYEKLQQNVLHQLYYWALSSAKNSAEKYDFGFDGLLHTFLETSLVQHLAKNDHVNYIKPTLAIRTLSYYSYYKII